MAQTYAVGDEPISGAGYRLTAFLGRGGFGEVWKATGPGGTEVALKIIRLGGIEGRKEFRALQLVKRIRHPNLVPTVAFWVRDAGGTTLDDNLVAQLDLRAPETETNTVKNTAVVRPLAAGAQPVELIIAMGLGDTTLHDRLQQCRAEGLPGIPPDELLHYMEGSAAAIDFLNRPSHDLGAGPVAIQHCDIKPQNIMIVGGAAQVCDFGLARAIGATRMTTAMAATVAYAAPEFLQTGKPSAASDQYSLAITYYDLRTGRLPYHDETYGAVMAAVVQGDLDLSGLTDLEQAALRRATSLDPAARYASAGEMVRALRAACQGQTEILSPAKPRRSALGGVLAAILLAALAAGVGYGGWRFWPRPTVGPTDDAHSHPPPVEHAQIKPPKEYDVVENPKPPPKIAEQPKPKPPNEAEMHLERGTEHLQAERYEQAIAEFELAAAANPGDVRIFSRLGTAWWRQDQPQQAVEAFSQALALAPDATDYVNRGRAYLDLEQHDKAHADFSQAIQRDSKNAAAYYFRGDGLLRQGKFQDAIADLNQAIKLAAQQPDADFDLAYAYIYRGSALLSLSQYEQAASDFSQAIAQLDPTDAAEVYRLRAECHQALHKSDLAQYDQQLSGYLEKLQQEPADIASLRAAAWLLAACPESAIRNGRHAVTLAQRACELAAGKDAACLDVLAAAHAEAGDFSEAVRRAEEAVRAAPDDATRGQYQSRLELYQAGKPSRKLPTGNGTRSRGS